MPDRTDFEQHNQETIQYYDKKIKKTMLPTGNAYTQHHLDEFLRVTGIKPGDRVLDVGCGMGRYTIPLAARGIRVEGLDISPFLLDRLKEYNGGRFEIPLYCLDIIDHPDSMNDSYDAVVGFFALHHMHDLAACFKAMAEVVKPGGLIAFIEPNAYNILYYLQIIITPRMTWKGDGGMAKMHPGVIFPAMRAAGLESPDRHRFGFFPPFLTNTRWGLWIEKRLEKFPLWRPLLPAVIFSGRRPG
ncbi:MAG TPA: methyltransferase domain-containing protein [Anaerolineales bacterium]|nr:methyltransferase domain-containing protein [Anaerolineales bacterium]